MKRIIIFGISLFVLGVGLFAFYPPGRRLSRTEDLPAYSLSPGLAGMMSSSGVYTGDNWGGQDILEEQLLTTIHGYLNRIQVSGLTPKRLREFPSAYLVELAEVETGRHAFGLMVNKTTGDVSPEVGPNLFWNTKYGDKIAKIGGGYGMEGQLMSGLSAAEMPLKMSEAREIAEETLAGLDGKKSLGDDPVVYYGFFEFYVHESGQTVGELDVNGYNGQVWYKDWRLPQQGVQTLSGE